jgi:hypothetical protein
MATSSKLNWKVLDPLLTILEKEGWTIPMIASDWGISLATLERHLAEEMSMSIPSKHDYLALIREYDQRLAGGESTEEIRATFDSRGINWGTFQNRRSQANKAHQSTPEEHQNTPEAHQSTPAELELLEVHPGTPEPTEILSDEQYTQEHPDAPTDPDHTEVHHGTLEGHQEVMEDITQSVPDVPHISTEEPYQSTSEHLSTPEVHQELSPDDSSMAHSGVPARQEWPAEVPAAHPGTPTADDWELWTTIKARWLEVEKMLAERHMVSSTPTGTPEDTQKKTYVFAVRHIALIDRYAQDHRLDLKDVIYTMCQEFFERRGYKEINQ